MLSFYKCNHFVISDHIMRLPLLYLHVCEQFTFSKKKNWVVKLFPNFYFCSTHFRSNPSKLIFVLEEFASQKLCFCIFNSFFRQEHNIWPSFVNFLCTAVKVDLCHHFGCLTHIDDINQELHYVAFIVQLFVLI